VPRDASCDGVDGLLVVLVGVLARVRRVRVGVLAGPARRRAGEVGPLDQRTQEGNMMSSVVVENVTPRPGQLEESTRKAAASIEAEAAGSGKNQSGKSGVAQGAAPPARDFPKSEHVKLADIKLDGENHRLAVMDEAAVRSLADSFQRDGQRQPVELERRADGSLWLTFGHRRYAAARLLKWETIRAEITGELDEVTRVAHRSVENLEREGLNPMEEAMAVSQMAGAVRRAAELKGEKPSSQWVCEQVGNRLGRPAAWVRDRMYLTRFEPTSLAWKYIVEGREVKVWESGRDVKKVVKLPLQHAREIAKLADPVVRDEMAEWALDPNASYRNEEIPIYIERLREKCEELMHSLKTVPWKLDVAFAGAPACSVCPSNSANDINLFEHDGEFDRKQAKEGKCLNKACFERKREEADRVSKAAARKIVKEVAAQPKAEQKKAVDVKALENKAPEIVRADSFAQQATQAIEKKAGKPKARLSQADKAPSAKQLAERDFQRALTERGDKFQDLALQHVVKKPGRLAATWLLTFIRAMITGDKLTPAKVKLIKLTAAPTIAGIAELEKAASNLDRSYLRDWLYDASCDGGEVLEQMLTAWGVELPPKPRLEDFMPKESKYKLGDEVKLPNGKKGVCGSCRGCGCSDGSRCLIAAKSGLNEFCKWADDTHTLCSFCAAKSPKNRKKGAAKAKSAKPKAKAKKAAKRKKK
jgi:hypothetical protein